MAGYEDPAAFEPSRTVDEDRALRALGVLAGSLGERAAQLEPCVADMYRSILRRFADATPPTRLQLAAEATSRELDLGPVIDALQTLDLIQLGSGGDIRVAYPFCCDTTSHRVTYRSGASVFAMCAVDALGIAEMLATDLEIESSDPVSGEAVLVRMHRTGEPISWTPADAVVIAGSVPVVGSAAEICCQHVHFFASAKTADEYARAHPQLAAVVVDIPTAATVGRRIFGSLLR